MLHPNFVIVGAIIGSIGGILYLLDTLKGKVKPNKVTFLLWSAAPLIAFAAEIGQGVGNQSLMTFYVGFIPVYFFVLSFFIQKAEWKITSFDLLCGALSVAGLIFWLVTKEGNIAIAAGLLADGLAALPTIVKSFKFPETENAWAYLAGAVNGGLTVLTIDSWTFAHWGFPIYILLVNLIIFVIVQSKVGKKYPKSDIKSY